MNERSDLNRVPIYPLKSVLTAAAARALKD